MLANSRVIPLLALLICVSGDNNHPHKVDNARGSTVSTLHIPRRTLLQDYGEAVPTPFDEESSSDSRSDSTSVTPTPRSHPAFPPFPKFPRNPPNEPHFYKPPEPGETAAPDDSDTDTNRPTEVPTHEGLLQRLYGHHTLYPTHTHSPTTPHPAPAPTARQPNLGDLKNSVVPLMDSPTMLAEPVPMYNQPGTTATPQMPVQASPTEAPAPTDPPMWQMIDPRLKGMSVESEGETADAGVHLPNTEQSSRRVGWWLVTLSLLGAALAILMRAGRSRQSQSSWVWSRRHEAEENSRLLLPIAGDTSTTVAAKSAEYGSFQ